MTEYPHCKYFLRNIKLTHEYLAKNTKEKLCTKVNETYLSYQPEQRGCALFFKIILYVLLYNSAETAKHLVSVVKTLKITDYGSNNFETVVSIIQGVLSRLSNIVDANGRSALPDIFSNYRIYIFRTTSVTKFNALCAHYSITTHLAEFHTNISNKPRISEILSFSETQYCHLYSISKWSGVDTKINATSFTANTNVNCLNCGSSHSLKDCHKYQNEERIKSNKKLFYYQDNKFKGNSDANKFIGHYK